MGGGGRGEPEVRRCSLCCRKLPSPLSPLLAKMHRLICRKEEGSDGFGPGPSPKARRPEAIFSSPARPEPDFLKAYSIENFGFGPKARRPETIFSSPARPEPDFFQPDPSLSETKCSSSFQNTVTKHAMFGRGENLATEDVLFSMPVDYSLLRSVSAIS